MIAESPIRGQESDVQDPDATLNTTTSGGDPYPPMPEDGIFFLNLGNLEM